MTTTVTQLEIRYISAMSNSCTFIFGLSACYNGAASEDSMKPGEYNDLSRPQDWQPANKEGKT